MHFKALFSRSAWMRRHGITKTLLVMKLTSILLLGACLQLSARVHSQTVSFSGKNVPLETIFSAVEKQTGYVFFFDEAILKDARPVTIRAENYSLPLFLNAVLNGQPFRFSFQNKTIVISRISEPIHEPFPSGSDSTIRPSGPPLHGVVMDVNAMPLPGASVTIKETGKSVLTDANGGFNIPATARNGKLIVSYVGYTTRVVSLAENPQMYIQLTVAVDGLDETVVQAYGKTSQRLSVANMYQVSGEEIQKQPVMNPLLALNGKVPGMVVTPTSGYASAPVKVEIRGRNTLDPSLVSDPLYVIDGVPLTILELPGGSLIPSSYTNGSTGFVQSGFHSNTNGQSPLFSINPADIESITVLKDAAATAIYGSRGANGVILITTKKAKPGKTTLSMQVGQTVSGAPRQWKLLNTPQYLQMRREAMKNDGIALTAASAPDLLLWDTTRYTNWQNKTLGVAKGTDVALGLSGGDRNTTFTLNAGYNKSQDLTTLKGGNQRITLASGIRHQSPDQKLVINFNLSYGYTNVNAITLATPSTIAPNAPTIFDAKGNLNYADWNTAGIGSQYPFASIFTPSVTSVNLAIGSLSLNYNLAKGLNLSVLGGYTNTQATNAWYNMIASLNPTGPIKTGYSTFGNNSGKNWNVDPQLNYTFYIGRGKLESLVGGSWQNTNASGITTLATGYTNDALIQTPNNAASTSTSGNAMQKKYVSIRGRINYSWENKYILEVDGNRDGSSFFGPGKQFGNFWSIGAGWIASEEEWFKRALPSWWSFLKFNGSYGIVGLDAGGAYKYLSQWTNPGSYAYPAYNGITPITPILAYNPDYQWQETRKMNADLTLGFLKDRITLTATYYRNRCNNQLTSVPTPAFTGFTSIYGNSPANVQNEGWEGRIHATLLSSKKFTWALDFNIAANHNILLSYPNFQFSPYYTTNKIGKSLNTVYLYHYLGINPQTGLRSFADRNHDGLIAPANNTIPPGIGNDDRYIALDPTPKYFGGITSTFTYKRYSLSLGFNYKKALGHLPYTGIAGPMGVNVPVDAFNSHWQKPGDQAINPRFTTSVSNSSGYFITSDGSYTDVSFLRLNMLALSWSLPEKICQKAHLQGINFTVNMSNVFTITSYKGLDPEITTYGSMPQPRIIGGRISFNL